jgi:phosphoglycerate dehydrogenase-like enzyme
LKKKALILADEAMLSLVFGSKQRALLEELVDVEVFAGDYQDLDSVLAAMENVQLLFCTWGMKPLDKNFIAASTQLEAIFYAAGSIRYIVSDEFWKSGIKICSAWAANAIPVAEMTLGLVILSLKQVFTHSRNCTGPEGYRRLPVAGAYESTVGLIGMGMIGRHVRELLTNLEVDVLVYDPYLSDAEAKALGVTKVSLDELFTQSDVVSLHAPNIPDTRNMIRGGHFRQLKPGATFINTARGALVHEGELIEVLQQRKDITAILDVTNPEPPREGSPLYTLPNVILTPHIAGSMGQECRRMAQYMVDECRRYLNGEPLLYQITQEMIKTMA